MMHVLLGRRRTALFGLAVVIFFHVLSCGQMPSGPLNNEWRFFPGHVEPFSLSSFKNSRPCWIYLPPGYASSARRYPTVYFLDGDIVFDGNKGMHMNRICDDLIRRGEIE